MLSYDSDRSSDDDLDPTFEAMLREALEDSVPGASSTPPPDPLILGGDRYIVRQRIGAGGMGIVYEVEDRHRGAELALKLLRRTNPESLSRFKNEFLTLSGVSHPNIVKLHDFGRSGTRWFFTMEMVRGIELSRWLDEHPEGLVDAFRQLAGAVAALHDADLLHRDLKPGNVLVDEHGRVKLLDFGLVTIREDQASSGAKATHIAGTPHFMAPEVKAGGLPSTAADWFALGIMLRDALEGRSPQPSLDDLARRLSSDAPADRPTSREVLAAFGTALIPLVQRRTSRARRFVGRALEQAELAVAFEHVERGESAAALIHGRTGIGKSALARHFLSSVGERALCLSSRCFERVCVPFNAFDGLLEALTTHLQALPITDCAALLPRYIHESERIFPQLGRVSALARVPRSPSIEDPARRRARALDALIDLLRAVGDRRPIVAFIDDLQWADADSKDLWSRLRRCDDPPRMLLLGAYRLGARQSQPCALFDCTRDIALHPLSPRESLELARHSSGPERAQAIANASEGDPFLIGELADHVESTPDAPLDGLGFETVLDERVENFSPRTRRLLEAIAVADEPTPVSTIIRASGDDPREALDILRANHLVRIETWDPIEKVECYHARVREAVCARLPRPRRESLHLALAMELERAALVDAARVARHYHGAGQLSRAASHAVLAGHAAARGMAFHAAAEWFARARQWGAVDPDGQLLIREAEARANAGQGSKASSCFSDAAMRAPMAKAQELRRRAVEQLLIAGHNKEGLPRLRLLCARVGLSWPRRAWAVDLARGWEGLRLLATRLTPTTPRPMSPSTKARLDLCMSATEVLAFPNTGMAALFALRGARLALRHGDASRAAEALSILGTCVGALGPRGEAAASSLHAAAASLLPTVQCERVTSIHRVMTAGRIALMGRWSEASRALESGLDGLSGLDRHRIAYPRLVGWSFWIFCNVYLGHYRAVRARAREMLRDAERRGDRYTPILLRTSGAWCLPELALDRPDDLAAMVDQDHYDWHGSSVDEFTMQGCPVDNVAVGAAYAKAMIALYRQGGGEELNNALRGVNHKLQTDYRRVMLWRWLLLTVKGGVLLRMHELDADARHLESATRCAVSLEREGLPFTRGSAALLEAGIASRRGESHAVARHLERAISSFELAQMPVRTAVGRAMLGTVIGGSAGHDLQALARSVLHENDIVDHARFTACLAPGIAPRARLMRPSAINTNASASAGTS